MTEYIPYTQINRSTDEWLGFKRRKQMSKIFVMYHGNCFDGMAAAWAAWKKFGDNAEYIPCFYNNKVMETSLLQDCYENANINDEYYILDFSFPRDLMELMASKAKKMVVLDHHKTAEANCKGLDFCIFDMEKSGARLAWEYFNPKKGYDRLGQPMDTTSLEHNIPKLIQYVEDRDLWRFKLPFSHEVNAFIQSWVMDFGIYNQLYAFLETPNLFERAIFEGAGIERYKNTMVEVQCKNHYMHTFHLTTAEGNVDTIKVPCANATILFSEVGERLCQMYPEAPFSAYFSIRRDGKKQWGLRSIGEFDVSEVAKRFGGGGHKNAAGFITE